MLDGYRYGLRSFSLEAETDRARCETDHRSYWLLPSSFFSRITESINSLRKKKKKKRDRTPLTFKGRTRALLFFSPSEPTNKVKSRAERSEELLHTVRVSERRTRSATVNTMGKVSL